MSSIVFPYFFLIYYLSPLFGFFNRSLLKLWREEGFLCTINIRLLNSISVVYGFVNVEGSVEVVGIISNEYPLV